MANKIKKGDLVTLIPAHPDHNKWFGIVVGKIANIDCKCVYQTRDGTKFFHVLGPSILDSYLKEEKLTMIIHEIHENNLFLIQESNTHYED